MGFESSFRAPVGRQTKCGHCSDGGHEWEDGLTSFVTRDVVRCVAGRFLTTRMDVNELDEQNTPANGSWSTKQLC